MSPNPNVEPNASHPPLSTIEVEDETTNSQPSTSNADSSATYGNVPPSLILMDDYLKAYVERKNISIPSSTTSTRQPAAEMSPGPVVTPKTKSNYQPPSAISVDDSSSDSSIIAIEDEVETTTPQPQPQPPIVEDETSSIGSISDQPPLPTFRHIDDVMNEHASRHNLATNSRGSQRLISKANASGNYQPPSAISIDNDNPSSDTSSPRTIRQPSPSSPERNEHNKRTSPTSRPTSPLYRSITELTARPIPPTTQQQGLSGHALIRSMSAHLSSLRISSHTNPLSTTTTTVPLSTTNLAALSAYLSSLLPNPTSTTTLPEHSAPLPLISTTEKVLDLREKIISHFTHLNPAAFGPSWYEAQLVAWERVGRVLRGFEVVFGAFWSRSRFVVGKVKKVKKDEGGMEDGRDGEGKGKAEADGAGADNEDDDFEGVLCTPHTEAEGDGEGHIGPRYKEAKLPNRMVSDVVIMEREIREHVRALEESMKCWGGLPESEEKKRMLKEEARELMRAWEELWE